MNLDIRELFIEINSSTSQEVKVCRCLIAVKQKGAFRYRKAGTKFSIPVFSPEIRDRVRIFVHQN